MIMRANPRFLKYLIMQVFIALVILVCSLVITPVPAQADGWVKGTGDRVWVDTSHYETRQSWIDTSYWVTQWQNVWVSSGYYYWVNQGHEDWVLAWMISDPPWGWPAWEYRWWYQYADRRCPHYYGGLECYENWTWGGHPHPGNEYCPGAAWRSYWTLWHDYGYYAWQDTSHYEWQPVAVLISQGYWQPYQVWVPSGYWTEPLHGTVTITKAPAYAFTKWHWLTEDGQWHGNQDEPAHLDFTVTWQTDRPIASITEYAMVRRYDRISSIDRVEIGSAMFATPDVRGTFTSRAEYDHAGIGTHYFIVSAIDGSKCVITCTIPINGFRSLNTTSDLNNISNGEFLRSTQDVGSVTF